MTDCIGGLDVHARSVRACAVRDDELVGETRLDYDVVAIEAKLREWGVTRCCYEAGPTGYGLQRYLQARGLDCEVIAPSLIPKAAGDRVKTDKRDARKLAVMYQAGMLVPIGIPDAAIEAVRNLVRVREDARLDRTRCRHCVSRRAHRPAQRACLRSSCGSPG